MKRFVLLVLLSALWFLPQAQTLQGRVTDAESGAPIEAATVSVLRNGKAIDYTLTDRQGCYSLRWVRSDTLPVRAALLGYEALTIQVGKAGKQDFRLTPATIRLHEVEIRSSRIYGRKDTLRFDFSRFATERDQHLRDVLRRLPGIEVEESGKITYQGKPIDHFLVEGMDLSGGRYNQLSNTLSAKAVSCAEIVENYQSIKALAGKQHSNQVALNLKLAPQVRDHWMWNATVGGGWKGEDSHGEEGGPLYTATLNALQLGRARQYLYSYKGNNIGVELSNEQQILTGQEWTSPANGLLSTSAFSSPLATQRTLFNDSHTVNANLLKKFPNDRLLRIQTNYTHDQRQRDQSASTRYFTLADTLSIDEESRSHYVCDEAGLEMNYEENNTAHLLRGRFRMEGNRQKRSDEAWQQSLHSTTMKAAGALEWLRNRGAHTWQLQSLLQASILPATLEVANEKERQRLSLLQARLTAGYLNKYKRWTRSLQIGTDLTRQHFTRPSEASLTHARLRLTPSIQYEWGAWLALLNLSTSLHHLSDRGEQHLTYLPHLYLRYTPNQHWKYTLFAQMERTLADLTQLYPTPYRTDYRTWYVPSDVTPLTRQRSLQLYGEYKNAVQEFFATLSVAYTHRHHNTLDEQYVSTDTTRYTRIRMGHQSEQYSIDMTLSKGIYDWHLKGSIELEVNRTTGAEAVRTPHTASTIRHYRADLLTIRPKLNWNPVTPFEVDYSASIRYGGTSISGGGRLQPLWQTNQTLAVSLRWGDFDLQISGEHYLNEMEPGRHLTTTLANTSLVYKRRKLRVELALHNLLDQKEYAYTRYSATQSYTSRLAIRPREVVMKADLSF